MARADEKLLKPFTKWLADSSSTRFENDGISVDFGEDGKSAQISGCFDSSSEIVTVAFQECASPSKRKTLRAHSSTKPVLIFVGQAKHYAAQFYVVADQFSAHVIECVLYVRRGHSGRYRLGRPFLLHQEGSADEELEEKVQKLEDLLSRLQELLASLEDDAADLRSKESRSGSESNSGDRYYESVEAIGNRRAVRHTLARYRLVYEKAQRKTNEIENLLEHGRIINDDVRKSAKKARRVAMIQFEEMDGRLPDDFDSGSASSISLDSFSLSS